LDKVLKLNPEHISCYGLKYEEGTPMQKMLEKGTVTECSEDMFADMYSHIADTLKNNGYMHYEISNFCKDGKESRHNLKYWTLCDYIGFGVSASSNEGYRRYTHSQYFEDYINGYKLSEDYVMDKEESMSEFVILGLRVLNKGVDKREFYGKYQIDFDEYYKDALSKVERYVINNKNTLKLRPEAALVSNSIMCEFMN
jgi:oxygen-independent coproporphyrinogen-3 oxidase